MTAKSLIVVALGGNAISRPEQQGNVDQQFANSRVTAGALADLMDAGHQLVITHGNGPQIGNFLLRNEAAADAIYALPMEVAVAHVQGGMGFMIAQTLTNELVARGRNDRVTALVTCVEVDANDPSFEHPTKPIGRVLSRTEAQRFRIGEGWSIKEVEPGKWRRVVPSPLPRRIQEIETIRRGVEAGETLIVCGGGGVPVVRNGNNALHGVAAVIDKDLASAMLAAELGACAMVILTNVDRISLDYGKPDERSIKSMTVAEARRHMNDGQFPPGSMGPKVQGAIRFLEASTKSDATVIIGPLHRAADALAGRTGTRITKE